MPNELYTSIGELVRKNEGLTIKLELADAVIACLRLDVKRLEDGQLELTVKLKDSDIEIGRLDMLVKNEVTD